MNLSNNVRITTALDYASGAVDRTGVVLDMQGFDGVLMVVKLAAVAGSANIIKAQQGAAANLSDAADLAGTGWTFAAANANQIYVIDVYKPQKRYVRLFVDKDGVNVVAESAIYIQYEAGSLPVSNNVANVVASKLQISPAEGPA